MRRAARGHVTSPFFKGGSRGISPRLARVRASANPPRPPFGKGGRKTPGANVIHAFDVTHEARGYGNSGAAVGAVLPPFEKGGRKTPGANVIHVFDVTHEARGYGNSGAAVGAVIPPFGKGGLGGISPRVARVRASANPPRPPFKKGGVSRAKFHVFDVTHD